MGAFNEEPYVMCHKIYSIKSTQREFFWGNPKNQVLGMRLIFVPVMLRFHFCLSLDPESILEPALQTEHTVFACPFVS